MAGNFVLIISGYLWFRGVTAGFGAGFAFSAILGWFCYFRFKSWRHIANKPDYL